MISWATKILCTHADHQTIVSLIPWPFSQIHRAGAVRGIAKSLEAWRRRQLRKKSRGGNAGERVGEQQPEAKDVVLQASFALAQLAGSRADLLDRPNQGRALIDEQRRPLSGCVHGGPFSVPPASQYNVKTCDAADWT